MKKQTPIIVVLSVAVAIGATVWLVVRWNAAGQSRIIVTTTGPLDIHLWGIRPNAGGAIYDPNGKKIRESLGIVRGDSSHWGDDSHRFDFIFELPDTNELPLLTRFPRVEVSYENKSLGGGFSYRFRDYEGKELLWLTTTLSRTFRRSILFGLWTTDCDVETIDITLSYYHGPPGKAAFTLQGPFEPNGTMTSEDGVHKVAFMADGGDRSQPYAQFVLTTSAYLRGQTSVVAYDISGRRYLVDTTNVSSSTNPKQGSRMECYVQALSLKAIAAIAFGEDPNRITFKTVNLNLGKRRSQHHAGYLDEMAERLNVNLTPKELADRRFKSGDEAVKVIDIIRGTHILWASEAILHGGEDKKRLDPATLDPQHAQRLKQTVLAWTRAMDPEIRACGVRVGLYCKWAEFVEPAFELLEYPAAYDSYLTRDVHSTVAQALLTYREQLSEQAIEHITRILLGRSDRDSLLSLRGCLMSPKSQARINGYWRLAEDDRPWLWWDAVDRLAQWGQFDGKQDSLPDKLQLRLVLLRGTAGFSDPRQIAPRAYSLLPELLRPELLLLDASTFYRVLERIAEKLDRERATEAVVNFLRCVEDYDYSGQAVVDKIVKYINLWHGLNIGELGADIDRQTSELQKYDWPAITAEAIKWYESKQDANDINRSGR